MSALEYAAENRTTVITVGGAIIVAGGLAFILTHSSRPQPAPPPPPVQVVIIQPPKPPPPPPPLPQPKTITPPKMTTPVMKPVTPTQQPPKAPTTSHMSTAIHGSTPDAFNLAASGNGLGFGNGEDGAGGSALSYFEGVVSAQIRTALQNNPVTRKASAGLEVRLWVDASGMVTQVQLAKSSGDPNVDNAITNQVLLNMHLNQPPPAGTPMPIDMSLTGEQPLQ
jgi:TonB family protein